MDKESVLQKYGKYKSIKRTAQECGVSEQVVKRILISEGICPSDRSAEVMSMYEQGMSVDEIADRLKIRPHSVISYLPYRKCCYAVGEPTANAKRIRKHRENKKTP